MSNQLQAIYDGNPYLQICFEQDYAPLIEAARQEAERWTCPYCGEHEKDFITVHSSGGWLDISICSNCEMEVNP